MNNVILVGKILHIDEPESLAKPTTITLQVERSFKNTEGEYDNDVFKCVLYPLMAETALHYCKVGDIVGIKGRLQAIDGETCAVAEKFTLLTSKKKDEVEDGGTKEN